PNPTQTHHSTDERARRASEFVSRHSHYVLFTMSRLHGRWWLTLLGTDPRRRKRVTPVIPRLPTTSKSYPPVRAVSMSAPTGSPSPTSVSTAMPEPAWRAASAETTFSPRAEAAAVKIVRAAPEALAMSTARSTAFAAV